MDIVINIDNEIVVESCIHNHLCIYVNLCQNFEISDYSENLYIDT